MAKKTNKQTAPPVKQRQRSTIMTPDDFATALFKLDTDYARLSPFFHSDRRTGHRWLQNGPSDPVARLAQLLLSLGLTLADAAYLIDTGVAQAGGGVIPAAVIDLKRRVAELKRKARRAERESHHGDHSRSGRAKAAAGDRPRAAR